MKKTFEQQSQQYRIARQQDSCPYSDERLAELISLAASGKRSPPAVVPSRADSSQSKFYSLAVATMAAE